jgi:hypothetical protein
LELRKKGVLIIGSGNIVHNLGRVNFQQIDAAYDWNIEFDTKNSPLPFSSFDQVDHFLINLFKYAKKVPNNKEPTVDFNKKFFKHYKKEVVLFKPIKYRKQTKEEAEAEENKKPQPDKESKGGRKTKNYRPKKRKTKSIKNRTRKNR